MEFISTKILHQTGDDLTLDNLIQLQGAIRTAIAISAYTDVEMIEEFIKKILSYSDGRAWPKIQIFLDFSNSGYQSNQESTTSLAKIAKKIDRNAADGSGVFLVRSGALFHSKCFLITSNLEAKLILGSLNLTRKGFEDNEELVLVGKGEVESRSYVWQLANWITNDYVSFLVKSSTKLTTNGTAELKPKTIRQVLLGGVMYHELKENDPFRFQLKLPDEFLEVDSNLHPLLEASTSDSISLERLIKAPKEVDGLGLKLNPKKSFKTSWKKYCLDTVYGFWSPLSLTDAISSILDQKVFSRTPYYSSLFEAIQNEKTAIFKQIGVVLGVINNQLKNTKLHSDWSLEDTLDRCETWYGTLVAKLESEEFKRRVVQGVEKATVPNVWSDPMSAKSFERSFAENLKYLCIKGETTQYKAIAKELIHKYGLDTEVIRNKETDDILGYVEKKLRG